MISGSRLLLRHAFPPVRLTLKDEESAPPRFLDLQPARKILLLIRQVTRRSAVFFPPTLFAHVLPHVSSRINNRAVYQPAPGGWRARQCSTEFLHRGSGSYRETGTSGSFIVYSMPFCF